MCSDRTNLLGTSDDEWGFRTMCSWMEPIEDDYQDISYRQGVWYLWRRQLKASCELRPYCFWKTSRWIFSNSVSHPKKCLVRETFLKLLLIPHLAAAWTPQEQLAHLKRCCVTILSGCSRLAQGDICLHALHRVSSACRPHRWRPSDPPIHHDGGSLEIFLK